MPSAGHQMIEEKIRIEAVTVFGSAAKAETWLNQRNLALSATPLSLLGTEKGAAEVRKLLACIAYGGAA